MSAEESLHPQLFSEHGRPRAAPRTPQREAPDAEPEYDPRQLQLLINPTEHIRRIKHSTDSQGLSVPYGGTRSFDTGGWAEGDMATYSSQPTGPAAMALPNPAPNEKMKRTWAWKEAEASEPEGSEYHGAGMYDLIASGEQIRNPVQVHIGDDPEYDVQYEGHHRVAAGHAVERDTGRAGSVWMPVQYNDTVKNYRPKPLQKHIEGNAAMRKRKGLSPRP